MKSKMKTVFRISFETINEVKHSTNSNPTSQNIKAQLINQLMIQN